MLVTMNMKGGQNGMKRKGVLLEGEWRGGEKRRRNERRGEEPGGKGISLSTTTAKRTVSTTLLSNP